MGDCVKGIPLYLDVVIYDVWVTSKDVVYKTFIYVNGIDGTSVQPQLWSANDIFTNPYDDPPYPISRGGTTTYTRTLPC